MRHAVTMHGELRVLRGEMPREVALSRMVYTRLYQIVRIQVFNSSLPHFVHPLMDLARQVPTSLGKFALPGREMPFLAPQKAYAM